jgi:hypothetical protein
MREKLTLSIQSERFKDQLAIFRVNDFHLCLSGHRLGESLALQMVALINYDAVGRSMLEYLHINLQAHICIC